MSNLFMFVCGSVIGFVLRDTIMKQYEKIIKKKCVDWELIFKHLEFVDPSNITSAIKNPIKIPEIPKVQSEISLMDEIASSSELSDLSESNSLNGEDFISVNPLLKLIS